MEEEPRSKFAKILERLAGEQKEREYNEEWLKRRDKEVSQKVPPYIRTAAGTIGLDWITDHMSKLKLARRDDNKNDLAVSCETIGNRLFHCGEYETALIAYGTGILLLPDDLGLKTSLYNCRSAADFNLGNFRSSLADCKRALEFDPECKLASARAVRCRNFLGKPQEDSPKEIDTSKEVSLDVINNVITVPAKKIRNRKMSKNEKRKNKSLLIQTIQQRNIRFEGGKIELESLQSLHDGLKKHRVSLIEGRLLWPTYVTYPDFGQVCLYEQFDENDRFQVHVNSLSDALCFDKKYCKHLPEFLRIYFSNGPDIVRFPLTKTLKEILSSKCFIVRNATPQFIVTLKDGSKELMLLAKYNLVELD